MQEQREQRLNKLAKMLLFRLHAEGQRYTLTRDVDVSKPVRHENLTLDEVEEILSTWKLRGFHGG